MHTPQLRYDGAVFLRGAGSRTSAIAFLQATFVRGHGEK